MAISPPRSERWIEWTLAAFLLALLVRVAFVQPMGLDEGLWLYMARAWVDWGALPYRGAVENKTPAIYYVYALSYLVAGGSVLLPRLAAAAAMVGASLATGSVARSLAGRDAGPVATLLAGVVMSTWAVDGPDLAMTESFMVLFTAAAIARTITGSRLEDPSRRRRAMLQAGAALGAAVAFKQVAVATAPAMLAFWWVLTPPPQRTRQRRTEDLGCMALAAALVTLASVVPLLAAGLTVREYLEGAWLVHTGKVTYMLSGSAGLGRHRPWLRRPLLDLLVAAAIGLAIWPLSARPRAVGAVVAAWLSLDAAAALAARTFFPHQFKQVVPAAAVAAGILVADGLRRLGRAGIERRWTRIAVLVLLAWQLVPSYATRWRTDRPERMRAAHLEVAAWIREHSQPEDYVFTYVGGGIVPGAMERRSPSRHFNMHFLWTRAAVRELQHDLEARPPRFVVTGRRGGPGWLQAYLARCCRVVREGERGFIVYERRAGAE